MKAEELRKIFVYAVLAIMLGLVLVPLVKFAFLKILLYIIIVAGILVALVVSVGYLYFLDDSDN